MAKYVVGRRSEAGFWEWWDGVKGRWGNLRSATKYTSFSTDEMHGTDCLIEHSTAKRLAASEVSDG